MTPQKGRANVTGVRTMLLALALAAAAPAHAQTLAELHWLKGCWRTQGEGAVVTEVWSAPPLPAMLGYSYTVNRAGETRVWEQARIEVIDDAPHFVAMPNGGAPVRFRMRSGDPAGVARFENPDHDYPQVVEYRRDGARLEATVSGRDGADPLRFAYRRIACNAALRP